VTRLALIAGLLAVLAAPVRADPGDDEPRHLRLRVAAALAAYGVYATSEYGFKAELAAARCRWCAPPGVDASVRDALVWDDVVAARHASTVTGYLAAPAITATLFAIAATGAPPGRRARRFVADGLAVAETISYVQVLTNAFKFVAARQRPYARFAPGSFTPGPDDNLSFFSGHTSFAFSLAVSAGAVAHRRHYALAPAIWGSGLALAAVTGYLRIAGDKHYLTDVIAGAAAGTAAGLAIPRLTGAVDASSASLRVVVVPTGDGLAIAGTF
jgi:membrane-associated phospholipid phosphatase